MSSLLTLHAPVPETPLVFEDMFFGEYTQLISLSQARAKATRAARALDAEDATAVEEHVESIAAYAEAWRAFASSYIYDAGSAARTRLPLEFSWRVALLNSGGVGKATVYTDGSPLLESACSTLALVAALQRRGAVDARGHTTDLLRARTELARLRDEVLEPLYVPRLAPPPVRFADNATAPSALALRLAMADEALTHRRRDAVVLSTLLVDALDAAIAGQAAVKSAVACLQAGGEAVAARMSSLLFAGTKSFKRASSLLPRERVFASSATSTLALAHRYTAQALVDSGDAAARGVAVTLARHAHAIDRANVAIERYMHELDDRNRLEFGMHAVPSWESVVVHTSAVADGEAGAAAMVRAHALDNGWRVDVAV